MCKDWERVARDRRRTGRVRVLWRPREELWEGRWKIRFKISKMSNIPNL